MPNSILPQDQDGQKVYNAISSFFSTFEIGNLLHKCNARKEKGIPVLDISKYKLCNVFSDRSMYICSRKPDLSGRLFQKIPSIGS